MKILIVDDNDSFRNILRIRLEKEGYDVYESDNGADVCRKCAEIPCRLVIMDLFLPEKDGVQTIHELKEEFSSDIKIIAISGAALSEGTTKFVLDKSSQQGADVTLKKPFKLDILVQYIETLCDKNSKK